MSTAGPPGTPGLRASRRAGPSGRLTNQRREGPGTGRRASAPRGGTPRARAEEPGPPSGTVRQRTACPHLSGGTKCRSLAKKITAPVGGAYPRTSAASSEPVSGHRTPGTTPSPLAGGAAGPPGRPPKPGSPEDRRGGRGDEILHTATVAGAGRGRHEPPRLRTGTRGGGVRGNVPPRRLRRTGLRRPTPTGPAARSLGTGRRGRKSRVGPTGTRACPRPGPPRPPRASPQGPAPVPAAGTGLRRIASGDTVPREHARGPGTPSPATRAGGVRSTSPDRDLGENSRGGASDDRPAGRTADGPAGPWPGHPARPRVGGQPPERDAGERKQSAIDTEGPTPGRPGRGPGGRAGARARPALSTFLRERRGTGERRSTRPGSPGDGRRSLPQKPAPPISGERATRRLHGTTGTIPPVTPAARDASPGTAARSLPLARSPELRREGTI